jgi:hypothetical protein
MFALQKSIQIDKAVNNLDKRTVQLVRDFVVNQFARARGNRVIPATTRVGHFFGRFHCLQALNSWMFGFSFLNATFSFEEAKSSSVWSNPAFFGY